uniref:(northern house mosquito) hypothetical protein n=1 Tax=Culex pipiens TaxID=7175 RepID=A0A8D8D302_CULPI
MPHPASLRPTWQPRPSGRTLFPRGFPELLRESLDRSRTICARQGRRCSAACASLDSAIGLLLHSALRRVRRPRRTISSVLPRPTGTPSRHPPQSGSTPSSRGTEMTPGRKSPS